MERKKETKKNLVLLVLILSDMTVDLEINILIWSSLC